MQQNCEAIEYPYSIGHSVNRGLRLPFLLRWRHAAKFIYMEADTRTYRLPSHWASALINGDYSGYSDKEQAEIEKFLSTAEGSAVDTGGDESFFSWRNDANSLGADCFDYTFLIHK